MNDLLGQELVTGDYVAGNYSNNNTPHIFQVVGYTPMKVRLMSLHDETRTSLKYSHDLIKLDPVAVQQSELQAPVDSLGQDLAIGDYVFASNGEYIEPVICEITGLSPRMAKLEKKYGKYRLFNSDYRLLTDVIKVPPTVVTMHCLKQEN